MGQRSRSGDRTAERAKEHRNAALVAAQRHHQPPATEVSDTRIIAFGFDIGKVNRAMFDDIRAHNAESCACG